MALRKRQRDAVAVMAEECLARRARLLSRTLTSLYDGALRPLGLTAAQLSLLVAVARNGPISPGRIAKRLNMDKSTMSRNVARLEALGQLDVKPGESGRQQVLEIRRKGRNLIEEALPHWRDAQKRAVEILGADGARSLREIANAVTKGPGETE